MIAQDGHLSSTTTIRALQSRARVVSGTQDDDPGSVPSPPVRLRRQHDLTFVELFSVEVRAAVATAIASVRTVRDHADELDGEQRDRLLLAAERGMLRIGGVLDDVLDLDRLDRGTVSTWDHVEVSRVVYAVAAELASNESLRVVAAPATVHGDEMLLRRAIGNLVRNAVVHTPRGTCIEVCVQVMDGLVTVTVDDDGPGIGTRDREQVFEPFDRGGAPPLTPGLGLGLALVRKVARLHRGRVWADVSPLGGARFVLELPVVATQDDPGEVATDDVTTADDVVIDVRH